MCANSHPAIAMLEIKMNFPPKKLAKSPMRLVFFVILGLGTTATVMAQGGRRSKTYPGPSPNIVDVQLGANNVLRGSTTPGTRVITLRRNGYVVAESPVDRSGRFEIQNMRGGQYDLSTGRTNQSIRAWAPRTGPPSSRNRLQTERPANSRSANPRRKSKFRGRPAWYNKPPETTPPENVPPVYNPPAS